MQRSESSAKEATQTPAKKEEPVLKRLGSIKRDTQGSAPNGAFEIGPIPAAYRPIFEEGDS